jgi:hypothetical protein
VEWDSAPLAREAHPREDQLLPLMVALGAAKQEAEEGIYLQLDFMGTVTSASYRFGQPDRVDQYPGPVERAAP